MYRFGMGQFRDTQLVTTSIVCFVVGVVVGYQFAIQRRRWLQFKKDYLKKNLDETKKRLDAS